MEQTNTMILLVFQFHQDSVLEAIPTKEGDDNSKPSPQTSVPTRVRDDGNLGLMEAVK